ncbi:MFS polyamine transporter [Amylocystis lapponica]|nr:MFS polyamine transporter [Amylocystis lapponica]
MASPDIEAQREHSNPSTLHVDEPEITIPIAEQPNFRKSFDNGTIVSGQDISDKIPATAQADNTMVVDWDGSEDPENPRNWTTSRKWAAALTVSAYTFISPVSSSMVAPAAEQIAVEFHITSSTEVSLTISIFVLAYAFGPLILGPLSEIYGRVPILQLSNIWYSAWNLGCAFAQNKGQLIAFRFLAGLGGSAPLAAGGAVLGDMWQPSQRGEAIAIYSLAPLLGPIIGPIAGGWIAERSTWRWVFRSTTIAAVLVQLVGFFLIKETFAPVLLQRKAKMIQQQMDAGEIETRPIRVKTQFPDRTFKQIMRKALVRPFVMFAQEPIIQLIGMYMAFVYGLIYLVLTTIPTITTEIYHETPGLFVTSQINARLAQRGVGKPEFRLVNALPGTIFIPAGLFIAGWGAQKHAFWIVPDIGYALIGSGLILVFQGMQSYVIDAFTLYAASALAAVSFLRSLAGFGFPLFAPAMYSALGYGVGDSILGAVAIVIGCPSLWAFWVYGERIRGWSKHAT